MNRASALDRSRRLVVPEMVGRGGRAQPDRPALITNDGRRTHAELDDRSARLATALAEIGVRSGETVALLLPNGFEFVESLLACHKLGACVLPLNFRLTGEEIQFILADAGAAGLIAGEAFGEMVASLSAGPASPGFVLAADDYSGRVAAATPLEEPASLAEDDIALLCYTSGTTGRPKGAMLSHRNLVASTMSWISEMGATADDVWLSGQPMFHIGGINGLLPFLALGATMVVPPSLGFDAEVSIDLLEQYGATMCIFVPTQWDAICASDRSLAMDRRRIRVAMWGASPASRTTLETMARTFPAAQIVSAYGQTEMSGATTLLKGPDATRKLGSVGKPMVGVELRLVDDELRDVAVGEVGEVVYRGPTVMSGYHRNQLASAEAFAGGWFHSGDLATRDDEGYLVLVDRKKDLIISGGENVYPAEVERVLTEHPAVIEAAVIGVPHPRWVETPVAFIVLHGAARVGEDDLIEHCRAHLASYKKPSAVVFIDALPRNAGGKVLKRELRERHVHATRD